MRKKNTIFRVLDVMETIDDDCDNMDVVFVAVKVKRQILCPLRRGYKQNIISRTSHLQPSTILMNFLP